MFNLKDVLPSSRSYYFYKGSFTTPPCTEGVNWVVLRQYATVTRRQAAAFPFTKNYQLAQPLNGRLVTINGLKKAPIRSPTSARRRQRRAAKGPVGTCPSFT